MLLLVSILKIFFGERLSSLIREENFQHTLNFSSSSWHYEMISMLSVFKPS